MKIRFCAALLLVALSISLFTGCAAANALNQPLNFSTGTHSRNAMPDSTPASTPAATGPSHPQHQHISKEEAQSIALTHAGVSAKDITRLRVEFDYDGSRPEYEVDFHYSGYEYDYEIDAETGKILSFDKDKED